MWLRQGWPITVPLRKCLFPDLLSLAPSQQCRFPQHFALAPEPSASLFGAAAKHKPGNPRRDLREGANQKGYRKALEIGVVGISGSLSWALKIWWVHVAGVRVRGQKSVLFSKRDGQLWKKDKLRFGRKSSGLIIMDFHNSSKTSNLRKHGNANIHLLHMRILQQGARNQNAQTSTSIHQFRWLKEPLGRPPPRTKAQGAACSSDICVQILKWRPAPSKAMNTKATQ